MIQFFNSVRAPIDSNPAALQSLEESGLGPVLELVERFSSFAPILNPILFVVSLYCTAKYLANSALISRLAYQELANHPESIAEASPKVLPRMWAYLRVGLEIGLRLFLLYILLAIAGAIVIPFLILLLGGTRSASPLVFLLVFVLIIAIVYVMGWFYSRWLISEVPLAVESGLGSMQSVKRSWDLTSAAVGRVLMIVFVAFLVTIPIQVITGYLPSLLLNVVKENAAAFWLVYLINLGISLIGGVLILPFWQSIKAVMYYDLRSRREGIDLQLRDR
ncbi:MAG: hypothetical protein HC856_04855 [Pseudanabaena sp. RU_4_16]|nr:hypothetical protein [Pseudanabaena sp. RU_4_16]